MGEAPTPQVARSTTVFGRQTGVALNRRFTAPIVMALGAWKTEKMMRRYAAETDATLRAAAEAVAGSEGQVIVSHGSV